LDWAICDDPGLMNSRILVRRMMAGDRLFFPGFTKGNQLGLYSLVRQKGRYLHTAQATMDGTNGLEVWIDDEPSGHTPFPDPWLVT
jgi:hypothetical protein